MSGSEPLDMSSRMRQASSMDASECTACGANLDSRDHFPGCGNGGPELWLIVRVHNPSMQEYVLASVVPGVFPVSALRQMHSSINDLYDDYLAVRKHHRPSNLLKG